LAKRALVARRRLRIPSIVHNFKERVYPGEDAAVWRNRLRKLTAGRRSVPGRNPQLL